MKDVLKKWGVVIVAALVMLGVVMSGVMRNSQNESQLAAQSAKIQELRGQLVVKEAALQQQREEASQHATGVDTERKRKDDELAVNLFKAAFTWDSYQTYMDARTKVMSMGIAEDSDFLKVVLPKVENRTDDSGKSYNVIDTQGLNMSYSTMDSRVSVVKVTDYSYFALLEAETSSKAGQEQITSYYSANYTTDANGKFIALTVDSIPSAPLSEG